MTTASTLTRPRPTPQPTTAIDLSDHDAEWIDALTAAQARHDAGGTPTDDDLSAASCMIAEAFADASLPVTPIEALNDLDNPIWREHRHMIADALLHVGMIDDGPDTNPLANAFWRAERIVKEAFPPGDVRDLLTATLADRRIDVQRSGCYTVDGFDAWRDGGGK